MLTNGIDSAEKAIALRALKEHKHRIFLNRCPNCNRLTRTPKAKQCRYCFHQWRDTIVGTFQLDGSFQLTDGLFYIVGTTLNGSISKGQFLDLTTVGLNHRPQIKTIEIASGKNENDQYFEHLTLGLDGLPELEKEFLKNRRLRGFKCDVLDKI